MPTHDELMELLSAYLDGELTGAQRAAVEQQLASDADARHKLDDLRRASNLVRQLPRERAPQRIGDDIVDKLAREELLGGPKSAERIGPWRFVKPLSLAAVIGLAVGAGWYVRTGMHSESQPDAARLVLTESARNSARGKSAFAPSAPVPAGESTAAANAPPADALADSSQAGSKMANERPSAPTAVILPQTSRQKIETADGRPPPLSARASHAINPTTPAEPTLATAPPASRPAIVAANQLDIFYESPAARQTALALLTDRLQRSRRMGITVEPRVQHLSMMPNDAAAAVPSPTRAEAPDVLAVTGTPEALCEFFGDWRRIAANEPSHATLRTENGALRRQFSDCAALHGWFADADAPSPPSSVTAAGKTAGAEPPAVRLVVALRVADVPATTRSSGNGR